MQLLVRILCFSSFALVTVSCNYTSRCLTESLEAAWNTNGQTTENFCFISKLKALCRISCDAPASVPARTYGLHECGEGRDDGEGKQLGHTLFILISTWDTNLQQAQIILRASSTAGILSCPTREACRYAKRKRLFGLWRVQLLRLSPRILTNVLWSHLLTL